MATEKLYKNRHEAIAAALGESSSKPNKPNNPDKSVKKKKKKRKASSIESDEYKAWAKMYE